MFMLLAAGIVAASSATAQTTTITPTTPTTTSATSAAPVPQSKLEVVGGETFDWGKTKPPADGHLEATIKMKNSGTKPMKLVEVKPGCGCTKTDPDKMEVNPNDVSTMGVKLNISPAQTGPVTKSITIRWMDLAAYEAREAFHKTGKDIPAGLDTAEQVAFLFLKADIQRAVTVTPSLYFSFQDLEIGKTANATVTVTNNSEQNITFGDFTADNGLVINQSGKVTLKPQAKFDLTATLVPAMAGQYTAVVRCSSTHPEHAVLEIRAYGFVKESTSPVFQQPK
jgi:hypothetical protein